VRVAAAHLELSGRALDAHQLAPAIVAADSGNGAQRVISVERWICQ